MSKVHVAKHVHPYVSSLYITYQTPDFIYFNLPVEINGTFYGNHFSVGMKDRNTKTGKQLIDLHYTIQDPTTQQSYNDDTKCWLYDGKVIDTNALISEFCEVPNKKTYENVYNNLFLNYIILILSAPFAGSDSDKSELKQIAKRIKATNSKMAKPSSSPVGGKRRFTV